jgi:type IV secretory pathway component VirB8
MSDKAPELSSQAVKFFAERIDWESSDRQLQANRLALFKWGMISGWVVAFIAIAAVIPLTALHDFIPITILVDKITGDYEVRYGKEKINVEDKANQLRMVADIGKFVRAREGFTRGEAEQNYRVIYNQLDDDLRPEWHTEFVTSKESPIKKYGAKDQIKLVNESIQWLPSPDKLPNHRVAQYRFDKIRKLEGRPATTQPYIATLTFSYNASNIPKELSDLVTNPYGFTVVNYRADAAGPERLLVAEQGGRQ